MIKHKTPAFLYLWMHGICQTANKREKEKRIIVPRSYDKKKDRNHYMCSV